MQKYSDVVLDRNGNAIARAFVYVYLAGSGTLATIYSDNGSTTQTNPMQADNDGGFAFYAANGRYDIKAVYGVTTKWDRDKLLDDPSGSLALWVDQGDVPIYVNGSTFNVLGDQTAFYQTGHAIRITDTGTYYGSIAYRSYSAPYTTIIVSLLNGASVSASISAAAVQSTETDREYYRGSKVTPREYHADSSGANVCTTPLRNMFTAAIQLTQAGNSGIYGSPGPYIGTGPDVDFERGVFKINDYITGTAANSVGYIKIKGSNAIIVQTDNTKNIFDGVGYDAQFERLTLVNGATQLYIKSANTDSTTIPIRDCNFMKPTTAALRTDSNSNSSIILVDGGQSINTDNTSTAHAGYFETGDWIEYKDHWISWYTPCAFYVGSAVLHLRDCVGVPGNTSSPSTDRWVDNYNIVSIDNFRFGGESGGRCFVRNYAEIDSTYPITPNGVSIKDSFAYSGYYALEFYKLPNYINIENLYGLVDNDGIYLDSGITAANIWAFQQYGTVNFKGPRGLLESKLVGHDVAAAVIKAKIGDVLFTERLANASDLLASGGYGGGWSVTNTNATTAFPVNSQGVQEWAITATAANGTFNANLGTFLNPTVLAYGNLLTLCIRVRVETASTAEVVITVGGATKTSQLPRGEHVVVIPFVYLNPSTASTTYDTLTLNTTLDASGDVVTFGRHYLVRGLQAIMSEMLVMQGTGAPSALPSIGYSNSFFKGDQVIYSAPTAAGFIGQVCTTAGNAGTWKTWGAVSA